MKRVSWLVAIIALACLVSESHAVRPPQHVAPVPPGGGARGDDDAPDKGRLVVVPGGRQAGMRQLPGQPEFEKRQAAGSRTFIIEVINIRKWLRLNTSRAVHKAP